MEQNDRELIKRVLQSNKKLRRLYEQHEFLERMLQSYNGRSYLSAGEELKERELKKKKLRGVDAMMKIVAPHRDVHAP